MITLKQVTLKQLRCGDRVHFMNNYPTVVGVIEGACVVLRTDYSNIAPRYSLHQDVEWWLVVGDVAIAP